MKKIIIIILALFLGSFLTVSAQKEKGVAAIGFYNLENLFDTENDPKTNDEQFLPEGDYRWTPDRYQHKLDNMSKVLAMIGAEYGGLVGVGVSELENRRVLEDLVAADNLKARNWGVVHYDSPDRRGVDVGFLYDKNRMRIIGSSSHRLYTADTSFRTRDQLLVVGVLDDIDTLHVIVNHWPSKRGGKKSIGSRAAAAQLTRSIADSVMKSNPGAKVIVMGDLNDDPDSKSILTHLKTTKTIKSTGVGDLFNPMYKMYKSGIGSYAYRDNWSLIDQIIVSYGLLNPRPNTYKFVGAKVFTAPILLMKTLTGSYEDYPFRTYAGGAYQGGFSDHFPVFIILKK